MNKVLVTNGVGWAREEKTLVNVAGSAGRPLL
jgi:hypothetical protein